MLPWLENEYGNSLLWWDISDLVVEEDSHSGAACLELLASTGHSAGE